MFGNDDTGFGLESKCVYKRVEFYYDKKNIAAYKSRFNNKIGHITEIIECLDKQEEEKLIYLRIHGYKQWCVIRIVTESVISKAIINKLNNICSDDLSVIVSCEDAKVIIKIIC